ncbi:hypothetical protein BHF71_01620 [Vulcanibacillus modesticaldus]|uniref:DUF4247 domain-containing protein n=1 Tax=Vulcanibacillus modesticaldus TaxID=337097 RepID=A0A1D2YUI4_9BACI|nr:DUF4247 domain-containing protein [Vulcanibacillus modesticaldus]OEF99315.1 hypothetical protein BHF71_01620 [Vulcanibacillus modesticaldus]
MKKRLLILLIVSFATLLLTGCGNVSSAISNKYPLENVVPSQFGNDFANIYRAQNQTVIETANTIASQYPPLQKSMEDPERMFLIYNDYLVTVMQDIEEPDDVLIEVADRQFVKDNYDLSLFEAYLIANIVEDIFEVSYKRKYRGYIGPKGYTPYRGTGKTGSIRIGSSGNTTIRGGGPSAGK